MASWCHHRNRFLLKNFMTTWLSHSKAIQLSFCVFLTIHFVYISDSNGFKCLYPPVLKCIGHSLNCLMSLAIFCHSKQISSMKHLMNFIFAPLRNYGWALFWNPFNWTWTCKCLINIFIIWQAPRAGSMRRILCFDWLPERARWGNTARPGLPVSFPQTKFRQSSSECTKGFFRRNYFLPR